MSEQQNNKELNGLLGESGAKRTNSWLLSKFIARKPAKNSSALANSPESLELKIQSAAFHDPVHNLPVARARWSNYMEYFLSIIGFVIDLGNVWRSVGALFFRE